MWFIFYKRVTLLGDEAAPKKNEDDDSDNDNDDDDDDDVVVVVVDEYERSDVIYRPKKVMSSRKMAIWMQSTSGC